MQLGQIGVRSLSRHLGRKLRSSVISAMFTGIIQYIGRIVSLKPNLRAATIQLTVQVKEAPWLVNLRLGDSVAVDGVCLTVTARDNHSFQAILSPETQRCTTLGLLAEGARVHLEPALNQGEALGGHYVTGHVDARGEVLAYQWEGTCLEICVAAPAALVPYIACKGSIVVDGVSLTVNQIEKESFRVLLLPQTLMKTTFLDKKRLDRVNIEVDLIARYVVRFMQCAGKSRC